MSFSWRPIQPMSGADLFSRSRPTRAVGRFLQFPITRILLVVLFLVPVMMVNALAVLQVIEKSPEPLATQIDGVRMLLTFFLLIASYRLYCAVVEKRPAFRRAIFRGRSRE